MSQAKLSSCAIVFVSTNIEKSLQYYQEVLGFRVVTHYENAEKFAALYRDAIEIVMVQAKFGKVIPHREAFGAGEDAYFVPETVEAVDAFHAEITAKGAVVLQPLSITPYGSREFSFEDCDGRMISVGRIKDKKVFFGDNQ